MFVFVSTCQFNLMQKLFNGSILMDSHFCLMSRMGLILMKHNPWCIKSNFFSQILFDTIEGSIIIQHFAQYQCVKFNYESYIIVDTHHILHIHFHFLFKFLSHYKFGTNIRNISSHLLCCQIMINYHF